MENLGTSPSANTISLSSTNVTVLTPDGLTQMIDLGLENINNIKALSPLAIALDSIYLSISTPAIKDIAGNDMSLAYLTVYEGKQPTRFTPDTTTPYLQWYDLDMDSGVLTLHFSETINSLQMDVTQLYLQEKANRTNATHPETGSNGTYYKITSAATKATSTPVPTMVITLSAPDVHTIKLMDMKVASSDAKTYLTFSSSLAKDMSALEIEVQPAVNGIR